MTLEEIQKAIAQLSLNDRTRLRLWLAEFDAEATGQKTVQSSTAEKLGRIAGRTFADFKKRLEES